MNRTASREFWKSTVKPAKEQQVLLHPEAAKRIDGFPGITDQLLAARAIQTGRASGLSYLNLERRLLYTRQVRPNVRPSPGRQKNHCVRNPSQDFDLGGE